MIYKFLNNKIIFLFKINNITKLQLFNKKMTKQFYKNKIKSNQKIKNKV